MYLFVHVNRAEPVYTDVRLSVISIRSGSVLGEAEA
jgi:hypothetical protein